MYTIIFPCNSAQCAAPAGSSLLNVLSAVGNLMRDHRAYGLASEDTQDQAVQLCETAKRCFTEAGDQADNAEGARLIFTSLGATGEQDIDYVVTVGAGLRKLLGSIATLIACYHVSGKWGSQFTETALAICEKAEELFCRADEPRAPIKVLIVIENGKVTPLCATAPVTICIVDKDGTPDADQSDRITLDSAEGAEIDSDQGFEARVLAAGAETN